MSNSRNSLDPNLGVSEIPVSHTGIRVLGESQLTPSEFWSSAELGSSSVLGRLVFEKHPRPMWICDAHSLHFLDVNDSAVEQYGYAREEFLQKTLLNIQLESVTPHRKTHERGKPTGAGRRSDRRHARKDGSTLLVEATSSVVELAGHQVLVMALTDVTDLFEAEDDVRRLVAAVEQTAESIVISDTAGVLTYVNPAFERITGYTRAEILGQNVRVLKSGQHPPEYYQQIWATLAQGRVWSGQVINKRKDGSFYREEMTISPVRDAAGNVINYIAVRRDVTRELALEEQLRQSQKMEAVGHLAGGIAHDFNNLLTVIQGNATLLQQEEGLAPSSCEFVNDIVGAAERASELTRQLLVVSRKQAMHIESVDVNEAVGTLSRMLDRVLGHNIALRCTFAPDLPRVDADRGMLQQVLLNVALNARDAMPTGGILLIRTSEELVECRADLSEVMRPGRYVCVHVSDTGNGISADNLPRIFDPFFTTKDLGKGTGLGLATVYNIVRQHHGWVEATSELGHGSTFRVYLPAAAGQVPLPAVEPSPSAFPRGAETVLVVEDDPAVQRTLCKVLRRCGYTVLAANSGVTALELWEVHKDKIRLLLTDVMMPGGLLGPQLALRLRTEKPELRVVFTSGYEAKALEESGPLGENFTMLPKPWRPHEVAEIIRASLDDTPAPGRGSSS